jgi:hypothetical protein
MEGYTNGIDRRRRERGSHDLRVMSIVEQQEQAGQLT